MSYPATDIDKVGVHLHEAAKEYARKAAGLASDPYFKEAVMKVSVSGFVWALHHAFNDEFSRMALDHELERIPFTLTHDTSPSASPGFNPGSAPPPRWGRKSRTRQRVFLPQRGGGPAEGRDGGCAADSTQSESALREQSAAVSRAIGSAEEKAH